MPRGHKGEPKTPGAGRKKGTPNKSTALAREAIALFVDNNAHRLEAWLDEIAISNPKAAFDSFMSVVEYHLPKLARTETKISGVLVEEAPFTEIDDQKEADRALEEELKKPAQ